MRKTHLFFVLISSLLIQPVFATDDAMMSADSKPCSAIAKACLHAGYARKSQDKAFWKDCMKPLLMGKTVKDVQIDSATVKSCRTDKINRLKQDLNDLQNVSS